MKGTQPLAGIQPSKQTLLVFVKSQLVDTRCGLTSTGSCHRHDAASETKPGTHTAMLSSHGGSDTKVSGCIGRKRTAIGRKRTGN
jgi:hypothetical protein